MPSRRYGGGPVWMPTSWTTSHARPRCCDSEEADRAVVAQPRSRAARRPGVAAGGAGRCERRSAEAREEAGMVRVAPARGCGRRPPLDTLCEKVERALPDRSL